MNQQRQHTRKDYRTSVQLQHDDNSHPGTTVNISQGGVFVITDFVPPFGAKLMLEISIPGAGDLCRIPCIVRWSKQDEGVGLQFEQLRAIEVWAINKLLKSL